VRFLRWAFLLAAPLVPWAQARIDRDRDPYRIQEQTLYVWSGEHVRRMFPGLENLMADVYWLRTVQFFGHQRAFATHKRFDLLAPLADITTTLDPRFELAYRYGALFLAEPYPNGAGDVKAAAALLQKGVDQNPENWRLRQDLGFLYFFHAGDAHRAAEIMMDASRVPGAPDWLKTTAASLLAKQDRKTARQMWARLHDEFEGPMKANAAFNLGRLDALDQVDRAQAVVDRIKAGLGRPPASWDEMLQAGLPAQLTRDPAGVPLDYDPATGAVSLSMQSPWWRQQQ
jgi:hypothetical protein